MGKGRTCEPLEKLNSSEGWLGYAERASRVSSDMRTSMARFRGTAWVVSPGRMLLWRAREPLTTGSGMASSSSSSSLPAAGECSG